MSKIFKKQLLIITFMICMLYQPLVFAEDVYVGETDKYTVYLRTESIKGEFIEYRGQAIEDINVKFNTIWMPTDEELARMRKLCIDDRIMYAVQDNEINLKYNRMTPKFKNNTFGVKKNREEYRSNNDKMLFYNDRYVWHTYVDPSEKEDIYRKIFSQVMDFIFDNKNADKIDLITK